METLTKPTDTRLRRFTETGTVYPILFMISITHLLNDMMQSVIPAVYPLLKEKFGFTFAQIGIITLVFQMTSSLLQPFIGLYADRHPRPYSLAAGMCFTLLGLFTLSVAPGFVPILLAVGLIGCGSSVFHPESSRVAQLASGGRKGLAQSIFQVGGNAGGAMGPLLAALVVIPFGQASIGWFALAAILAILILTRIGNWYKLRLTVTANHPAAAAAAPAHHLGKRKIRLALGILGVLVFSKYFYIASMTNYFTFFLMDKFGISVQGSQYCLFAFLGLRGLLGKRKIVHGHNPLFGQAAFEHAVSRGGHAYHIGCKESGYHRNGNHNGIKELADDSERKAKRGYDERKLAYLRH